MPGEERGRETTASVMAVDPGEKGLQGGILLKPMSGLPIFRSEVIYDSLVCDGGKILSKLVRQHRAMTGVKCGEQR